MSGKKIVLTIVLSFLVFTAIAEPWDAVLTLSVSGSSFDLGFGRTSTALVGLDGEDDILPLAPPSGPYAYFELDDPANPDVTMLYTDIQPDDGSDASWTAHLASISTPQIATWIPEELPSGNFFIGIHYDGTPVSEWYDMKMISSIELMPMQLVEIMHQPGGYFPDDDPVFSNWYPEDGATGIPVTTTVHVDVTDAGSGIDPSSITMDVNGTDVTDGIVLSPITNGYRVSYEPELYFAGESWISVIVEASDNASPANSSSDVIAFRTGHSIMPVLWDFSLMAYTIDGSSDTSEMELILGADPAASSGFDLGMDVIYPVAPPSVFYAYFPLDDPSYPLYNMLVRDIHDSGSILDNWNIAFGNTDPTVGIKWNISDIPADKDLFAAATFPPYYPDGSDWIDMRTQSSLEFGPGRWAWIKVVSPSGDTAAPRVVFTDPASGATGVSVSTEINACVIDEESGVDDGSIAMTVDGVNVTTSLLVSSSSGTTYVRYIPPTDFSPLSTVNVELWVSDLADPANTRDYSWSFVTGYFLTPAWMESVTVWTDDPEEPLRHFTLKFGADSAGTDLFDYGLDQQMPPPPPGDMPYGYFEIADTFWNQLSRDIRSSSDDLIIWSAEILRINPVGDVTNWISWDSEGLPGDGSFDIAWVVIGDTIWQNMRSFDRIDITTSGNLLIRFTRGVPPTYCLSGIVYDTDSVEIEEAEVWIYDSFDMLDSSDATGFYEICGITMGTYIVITSADGYYPDTVELTFESDLIYNPILTPMPPPLSNVHGTISCSDDGSPESAMVILGDDTTFADTAGFYVFYDVPYDDYTVDISLDYYTPISTNIIVDDPDETFDFELDRQTGRIVGTITLEDTPPSLAGTMVELTGTSIPPAYTNGSGFYIIADVPYGFYNVTISHDGYIPLDTTFELTTLEDTLNARLLSGLLLNPPRNLEGSGQYTNRAVLDWDPPEPSSATLLGYNIYRERPFGDDTLTGYVPEPYTNFVEWNLWNYLPYTYNVTAVYEEGESEPEGPFTVWITPDSATADILIWDYDNGALLADGCTSDEAQFLRNRILGFGQFDVAVTGQDENLFSYDLFAHRAVFVVLGVDDANNDLPHNGSVNRLASYIAAGGRVYLEGADFGYDFGSPFAPNPRKALFGLFGVDFAADGYPRSSGNVESLLGEDTSFFTEGVVNIGYPFQSLADQRIDEWSTDSVREGTTWAMFSQDTPTPEVSSLRMVYRRLYAWKTVLSSVYLGAMIDGDAPSTGQHVLAAIINFLLDSEVSLVKEDRSSLPTELGLEVSPNPFNSSCKILLKIDKPGELKLDIFDMSGRRINTLANENVEPGTYSAIWDSRSQSGDMLPSGVYFAVLKLENEIASMRLLLIK